MRLGCKGAKDAVPPQDDLKEERWPSDEVTSPSLYSLEQDAADEAAERTENLFTSVVISATTYS